MWKHSSQRSSLSSSRSTFGKWWAISLLRSSGCTDPTRNHGRWDSVELWIWAVFVTWTVCSSNSSWFLNSAILSLKPSVATLLISRSGRIARLTTTFLCRSNDCSASWSWPSGRRTTLPIWFSHSKISTASQPTCQFNVTVKNSLTFSSIESKTNLPQPHRRTFCKTSSRVPKYQLWLVKNVATLSQESKHSTTSLLK